MVWYLYLAFVVTALALLALLPTRGARLVVNNTVAHGSRAGLFTTAGTSSALLVHVLVAFFVLASALKLLGERFERVRWIGLAYLLYWGINQCRAQKSDRLQRTATPASVQALFGDGFFVSLSDLRTLLSYCAIFPQFVNLQNTPRLQLAIFCLTHWLLGVGFELICVRRASRMQPELTLKAWRKAVAALLLVGLAVGFALIRKL